MIVLGRRGARRWIPLLSLVLLSSCAGRTPVAPPASGGGADGASVVTSAVTVQEVPVDPEPGTQAPPVATEPDPLQDRTRRPAGRGNPPPRVPADAVSPPGPAEATVVSPPARVVREAAPPPRLADLIDAEEARLAAGDKDARRTLAGLYALAGRWPDAYRMTEGMSVGRDDFLRLTVAVAADQVNEHRLAMAALETVRDRWREIHPLAIPLAAFCSAARGFQDYTPVARSEFDAGQVVVVYFELDNFATRPAAGDQHEVLVKADAEVVTLPPGQQVIRLSDAGQYAQEFSRKTARAIEDLGLGVRLQLPRNLVPGAYQLRLTVQDRVGGKSAQTLLDFRIRG